MNLVKLITDQFSDETLGKLGALLSTDSETTSAAATAALPTLLSGLAGMAARGDDARKLTEVLGGIDTQQMGNLSQLLGGDTSALLQRGSGLLNALFGDGLIASAANAISRYSGIKIDTAKTLLASLLPIILGKVAAQWSSAGGTVDALASLFANQRRNIADAVPAGFPLDELPDIAGAGARAATDTARRGGETAAAASGSIANWLLPLAVLIVGGFLLWNFLSHPADDGTVAETGKDAATTTVMKPVVLDANPASPDTNAISNATQVTDDVTGVVASFSDQLAAIKDASSGEAALPKLQELKMKLDGILTAWAKLPNASQLMIRQLTNSRLQPLKRKVEETLAISGLSDRIQAIINDILQKLSELATPPTTATPAATQ